jgi:predicted RNA-binding Zn ribbon-like protein
MTRMADPYDWSGGHPALDFANTLDERPLPSPIENLAGYKALVRFTELAELIEPAAARRLRSLNDAGCARVVRRARELREQLFTVLTAIHAGRPVPSAALDAIASEVRKAHVAQTFASTGVSGKVTRRWAAPAAPEIPLHACALAVEDLLMSAAHARIRKCAAADCAVYFIDTSKAYRRQWCSMQNCGNREKQRRWRAE